MFQNPSNLSEAMGKAMEDMTSNAQLKPMLKPKDSSSSNQSLFLFVTSIARTNLEVELIQRGGTLVQANSKLPIPLLPIRDCIGKIIHKIYSFLREIIIFEFSHEK